MKMELRGVKQHSPAFEKALQEAVEKAVAPDPVMAREYRQNGKVPFLRRPWANTGLRLMGSLFAALLVWNCFRTTHRVDAVLLLLNLWMAGLLCFSIYPRDKDVRLLRLLPLPDEAIVRWELDKVFRRSFFLLGDLILVLFLLGWLLQLSPITWAGLVALAPVAWLFQLALTARIFVLFYEVPVLGIFLAMGCFYFVLPLGLTGPGSESSYFFQKATPVLNVTLPTGWIFSLFQWGQPSGSWWTLLLLAPVGWILWSIPASLRSIRHHFSYRESDLGVVATPSLQKPRPDEPALPMPVETEAVGITAIEEDILSGEALARKEWAHTWLERKLWSWFTPQEKNLAEFAFPYGLPLSLRPLLEMLWVFLLIVAAILIGAWIDPIVEATLLGCAIVLFLVLGLWAVVRLGVAFRLIRDGGTAIPLYAAYPIDTRMLTRMLLKCSAVQMPGFLLLAMACMFALEPLRTMSIAGNLLGGINLCLLAWSTHWLTLTCRVWMGRGGMWSCHLVYRLSTLCLILGLGLGFLALASFGAAGALLGSAMEAGRSMDRFMAACPLLTLLAAYAFHRFNLWYQGWGRFDHTLVAL